MSFIHNQKKAFKGTIVNQHVRKNKISKISPRSSPSPPLLPPLWYIINIRIYLTLPFLMVWIKGRNV